MRRRTLAGIVALIGCLWLGLVYVPVKKSPSATPGFTPMRDDALALKYVPVLYTGAFETPHSLYYRAARDEAGRRHITYHYVWDYERNEADGFGPLMSRLLYTGGLRLQRLMYGKGDIEMVSVVIDSSGDVIDVVYETAEGYDPRQFGVAHRTIRTEGKAVLPLRFRVVSWNHLFERLDTGSTPASPAGTRVELPLRYFDRELWEDYEMWKPTETVLKKSRAHQPYERLAAGP
ncbi:MAG: hypothetical protein HY042_12315 [Spirochaetia bacterium]|nr:hypothetical protein [Spirochaetia bacterium]